MKAEIFYKSLNSKKKTQDLITPGTWIEIKNENRIYFKRARIKNWCKNRPYLCSRKTDNVYREKCKAKTKRQFIKNKISFAIISTHRHLQFHDNRSKINRARYPLSALIKIIFFCVSCENFVHFSE